MDSYGFPYGVFVNADSYVFINTWNTESYIPLSLRQNNSRNKIWHWLELGCFCKWKQWTSKEMQRMEWFWFRRGFILTLSIFIWILFILRLAAMSPCKSDTPHLRIIKDKLGDKRYERECWILFTYIVLM